MALSARRYKWRPKRATPTAKPAAQTPSPGDALERKIAACLRCFDQYLRRLTQRCHGAGLNAATKIHPLCTDMCDYEIRIVRSDGQQLVVETRLMGDHAAVRRAKSLALNADQIEVWRGMVCVYSTVEAAA